MPEYGLIMDRQVYILGSGWRRDSVQDATIYNKTVKMEDIELLDFEIAGL